MVTKKTFYAIKAMRFLAKRKGHPAYSAEIAIAENIPKHFLEKILTELRNAGFLHVVKGISGGYSILPDPKEITIANILQLMQGAIISSHCINESVEQKCDECSHKTICGISEPFIQIRGGIFQKLAETNLKSLISLSKIPNEYKNTIYFDYDHMAFLMHDVQHPNTALQVNQLSSNANGKTN